MNGRWTASRLAPSYMCRAIAPAVLLSLLADRGPNPAEAAVPAPEPLAAVDGMLSDLTSGRRPFDGLMINPNPHANGPAYTTGNSTTALASESQVTLPALWGYLFQPGTAHTHDVLTAIVEPVPGTTSIQVNALAGYVYNLNPASQINTLGVGVAIGGYTVNAVDGAQSWGIDLIQTDTPESGGPGGRLLQNEADFKPQFANTAVNGFILAMDAPLQPTTADGWICGKTPNVAGPKPSGVGLWNHCLMTYPGSAVTAVLAGTASAAGTPMSDSQNIDFQVTSATGAFHNLRLRGTQDAYLALLRDDAGVANLSLINGSLFLESGHTLYIDGQPMIGGPAPSSSRSPCTRGATTSDASFIYACVATNIWKRAPLSNW
jgi:hypothetical protein